MTATIVQVRLPAWLQRQPPEPPESPQPRPPVESVTGVATAAVTASELAGLEPAAITTLQALTTSAEPLLSHPGRKIVLETFLDLARRWHGESNPKLHEVAPAVEDLLARWRDEDHRSRPTIVERKEENGVRQSDACRGTNIRDGTHSWRLYRPKGFRP